MTVDEIKNTIEAAFPPLRCVAEIWDYERNLRFAVFGPDGSAIYEVKACPLSLIDSEDKLRIFLVGRRSEIEEKGVALDPWNG